VFHDLAQDPPAARLGRLNSLFRQGPGDIDRFDRRWSAWPAALAAFLFLNTAAPRTLTISSGPAGSSFQRTAERYQKILERDGVAVKILPSDGSAENLKRLADPKQHVDVGFVLGGAAGDKTYDQLHVAGQPWPISR
jgi:hypothetical protein